MEAKIMREIFCHNLRWLRKKYALTKKQMAEILGVGEKTVEQLEKNNISNRISCDVLCNACNYFKLSADEMLRDPKE